MLNYEDVTPTRILSIAIRKRRELCDQKEPDMYRELLNKALIQHLCQQLGQRCSRKSRRQRRKNRSSRKRHHSGAYIDKGETSSNALDFEVPSMVRHEDYDQMEQMLETNESTILDGHRGQWSDSEKVNSPIDSNTVKTNANVNIDPNDPLEMNQLFHKLYDKG